MTRAIIPQVCVHKSVFLWYRNKKKLSASEEEKKNNFHTKTCGTIFRDVAFRKKKRERKTHCKSVERCDAVKTFQMTEWGLVLASR